MNPVRRGNLYMLIVLLSQIFVMLLFPVIAPFIAKLPYSMALSTALTQVLCFLTPFLGYWLLVKPRRVYAFKRLNLTNTVLILFMCIAIQPVMAALSALSMIFFENPVSEYLIEAYAFPLPVLLFVLAVVPAFCEELTLRGVVLKNHEGLPIRKAAIVNGVFFGILHLSPQQFLYAFMMGMVFSYFVYYTKSIWASMLGHFIVNATQIVTGFLSYRALESLPADTQAMLEAPTNAELVNTGIFLAVLSAIFLPVFLILFRSFIGYNKRRLFLEAMADAELVSAEVSATAETPATAETTVALLDIPPVEKTPQPEKVMDWAFLCVIVVFLGCMALMQL